jgi:hypothetical protein
MVDDWCSFVGVMSDSVSRRRSCGPRGCCGSGGLNGSAASSCCSLGTHESLLKSRLGASSADSARSGGASHRHDGDCLGCLFGKGWLDEVG